MRKLVLISIAALLASCAPSLKTVANFEEVAQRIESVAVMPTVFEITKVSAFSGATLTEMQVDVEMEIKKSLELLIDESEYDAAILDVSDQTLASDPEFRQALFSHVEEIAQAFEDASKTKGAIIDVDYTADIDYFADRVDSDYLLFVQGSGWFKTGGARFMAALFATGEPSAGTWLHGFVVDANTSKVIWYNEVFEKNRDPRKPSNILKSCQKLMEPLLGKSAARYDGDDNAIIDRYKHREDAVEDE